MTSIAVCVVANKSNDEEILTILTKWNEDDVRFIIVRQDGTHVTGQMMLSEFGKYAENFQKTLTEYVQETQDILSGNKQDIDFNLKESQFTWKRKNWLLGQLTVGLASGNDHMLDIIIVQNDQLSKANKKITEQQKLLEICQKSDSDKTYKMNKMILQKEQMEMEYYIAFKSVLNAKKAKMREMQIEIDRLHKIVNKDTVYDATTDESDSEADTKNDLTSQSVLIKKFRPKRPQQESIRSSSRLSEKRQKITSKKKVGYIDVKKNIENGVDDEQDLKFSEKVETNNEINIVDKHNKIRTVELEEESVNHEKSEKIKDKPSISIEVEKEKSPQNIEVIKDSKEGTQNEFACKDKQITITEINTQNIDLGDKVDLVEKIGVSKEKKITQAELVPLNNECINLPSTILIEEESEVSQVDEKPCLSISKNKAFATTLTEIGEDEETPDILSDESDCEMELKLEEDKDDEEKNKSLEKNNTEKSSIKEEQRNDGNEDKYLENEIDDEKRTILEQDSEEMVF